MAFTLPSCDGKLQAMRLVKIMLKSVDPKEVSLILDFIHT